MQALVVPAARIGSKSYFRTERSCLRCLRSSSHIARPQAFEACCLVRQQVAFGITTHEDLEHRGALAIEELNGAGWPAVEDAGDEGDFGTVLVADMPADGTVAMEIEVAVSDLA